MPYLPPAPPKPAATAPATTPASTPASAARTAPVGLPLDAGPHDKDAAIEWWYFNALMKTESGKNYAVVGSFFRLGLAATNKGHYLIYSLADLDTKKVITTGSILDKANVTLLKAYLAASALFARADDPAVMPLLAALQKNQLPAPHKIATETARVTEKPRFSIAMDGNAFAQKSDDGRMWQASLTDPTFALTLDFDQPADGRAPMLVGGAGKTGLDTPDDMYYLSLTHTSISGLLTIKNADGTARTENVSGAGWVDRQWGRSWIVRDNGWDWFGVHLSDDSDLIVYRIKDNKTGKVLRAEATLQKADGSQSVDTAVTFASTGTWKDPTSSITFPEHFAVNLNTLGYKLIFTPAFDAQAIPTIGIGAAFWEGVVDVTGTTKDGATLSGRGYRELVGYKPASDAGHKTRKNSAHRKP